MVWSISSVGLTVPLTIWSRSMIHVSKDKIQILVTKIIEDKDKKIKSKVSGLTEEDIQMWDRIFNAPEPEPIYQDHFALSPVWKAKHKVR